MTGSVWVRRLDERILRLLPGSFFMRVRLHMLRKQGAVIGTNVILGVGVRVICPERLVLDDDVSVARDVVLDARGGLVLASGALIGFESIILTSTHQSGSMEVPVHHQGMYEEPVRIGQNTWLGTRCIVMPGASVGDRAVVGSAAVVTKDVPPGSISVGTPARRIRDR